MNEHLIILGASTRAAATSARRAGLVPWCADLFADADLQRIATVQKVPYDEYPAGLLRALECAPPGPVLYSGALENRPDLIGRIDRPLWGNSATVLRAARSPARWEALLRAHGIACPQTAHEPRRDGDWLIKPHRSAGGVGIARYRGEPFHPRTHFLQQRIDGEPCSAIYLGTANHDAVLLGVTKQLIGIPWLNAKPFQYCGTIGPTSIDGATKTQWQRLGSALAKLGLRGLFGVDAILRDGLPWPVEINPRYTASIEILERSQARAFLTLHRGVFEGQAVPISEQDQGNGVWAKAILFARRDFTFPAEVSWLASLEGGQDLDAALFADIPHPGQLIEQGWPILTLFARGSSEMECTAQMQGRATELERHF
jgi:predicted ATP-grasp superfamily ATP-dependent carboligase